MKKSLIAVVTFIMVCIPAQVSSGHSPDLQLNEVVHMSDAIFIGRVSSIQGFDGGGGMVGTEVVFTEVDALSTRPSARSYISDEVLIRFAGGTHDGVAISVCCQPHFELGEDYLVCTLLDGKTYLSPFSGGTQGLFRILQDERGNMFPLTYSGRGIKNANALGYSPAPTVEQMWQGKPIYAPTADFVSEVEAPRPASPSSTSSTRQNVMPTTILNVEDFVEQLSLSVQTAEPAYVTVKRGNRLPLSIMKTPKQRTPLGGNKRMYDPSRGIICWCGYQPLFVVMQQVPEDWLSFDNNNWAMANYNNIADLFRFSDTDGSWGTNGVNEFCGWPSDAEIQSQFSSFTGWGTSVAMHWGSTYSGEPCGEIIESNIMFNRAESWGFDLDDTFGTTSFLYRPTVTHELGHAIGLERGNTDDGSGNGYGCGDESYEYDQPTTMTSAYRTIVENGKGLHSLDAAGVRGSYSGDTEILDFEDVGVESYYGDAGMENATTNSTWLNDGDTLELYNVTVENISNSTQANVKLRVYLSGNNTISEGDKKIATFTFSSMSAGSFWTGDLSMTIPQSVSTGDYYIGLIATLDGSDYWWDDYSGNNATWMPVPIHVANDGAWVFNDVVSHASPIDLEWLAGHWWVDNSGADDDEGNGGGGGICGTMYGRDLWWFFDADFDGDVVVGLPNVEAAGDGQGLQGQALDFVEIYRGYPDIGDQPIAASCATAYEGPAVGPVTKGERYYVRIGGVEHAKIMGFAQLNIIPMGIVGDTPAIAIPVEEGATFAKFQQNATSFFPDGGPCGGGSDGLIDKWFIYTPKHEGTVVATTCGSGNIDTIIGVFTQALQPITCNDDSVEPCLSGDTQSSTAYWDTTVGETYLIQVLASPFDQSEFDLTISTEMSSQPNGDCDSAEFIVGDSTSFTTRAASTSGTYDCSGNPVGCDVWFKWVATDTGTALVGTCEDVGGSANFDSIVNVYDGCTMEYLLACNTSSCSDGTSIATLSVIKGNSYLIQVGSSTSELGGCVAGDGSIGVVVAASCLGDINGDGVVGIDDILRLISDWGSSSPASDLDQNGVVAVGDLLILIEGFGACP